MPGSKKTTTQTQESNPWSPAQPVLQDILTQAQGLAGNTAAFTPTYGSQIDAMYRFASSPSQVSAAAAPIVSGSTRGYNQGLDELMATAGGQRMTGNPYMDAALSNASRRTADQVNAQFSGAGRYGSGAHTGVLADRLGELETSARMGQYNTERQNQLGAANTLLSGGYQGLGAAGAADAAEAQRAQALIGVGQLVDQQANANRMGPMTALDWLRGNATQIGAMGGQSSGTTTQTTPADKLGMMVSGAQMIGGLATGNPMMALGGLGGLGGVSAGTQGMMATNPTYLGGYAPNPSRPWG